MRPQMLALVAKETQRLQALLATAVAAAQYASAGLALHLRAIMVLLIILTFFFTLLHHVGRDWDRAGRSGTGGGTSRGAAGQRGVSVFVLRSSSALCLHTTTCRYPIV